MGTWATDNYPNRDDVYLRPKITRRLRLFAPSGDDDTESEGVCDAAELMLLLIHHAAVAKYDLLRVSNRVAKKWAYEEPPFKVMLGFLNPFEREGYDVQAGWLMTFLAHHALHRSYDLAAAAEYRFQILFAHGWRFKEEWRDKPLLSQDEPGYEQYVANSADPDLYNRPNRSPRGSRLG